MMKNIMISVMLAASTCFAMIGSANVAFNDTSKHTVQTQHHKNEITANKNKASNHKTTKQQPKAKISHQTKQKVSQKTNHNSKNNQLINQKTSLKTKIVGFN